MCKATQREGWGRRAPRRTYPRVLEHCVARGGAYAVLLQCRAVDRARSRRFGLAPSNGNCREHPIGAVTFGWACELLHSACLAPRRMLRLLVAGSVHLR